MEPTLVRQFLLGAPLQWPDLILTPTAEGVVIQRLTPHLPPEVYPPLPAHLVFPEVESWGICVHIAYNVRVNTLLEAISKIYGAPHDIKWLVQLLGKRVFALREGDTKFTGCPSPPPNFSRRGMTKASLEHFRAHAYAATIDPLEAMHFAGLHRALEMVDSAVTTRKHYALACGWDGEGPTPTLGECDARASNLDP